MLAGDLFHFKDRPHFKCQMEQKQDCERKASYRLMERFKKKFPRLPVCFCADSLYACENFFNKCRDNMWRYILRYKEGSIPTGNTSVGYLNGYIRFDRQSPNSFLSY